MKTEDTYIDVRIGATRLDDRRQVWECTYVQTYQQEWACWDVGFIAWYQDRGWYAKPWDKGYVRGPFKRFRNAAEAIDKPPPKVVRKNPHPFGFKPADPDAPPPKPSKPAIYCSAVKASGHRCGMRVKKEGDLCAHHQPKTKSGVRNVLRVCKVRGCDRVRAPGVEWCWNHIPVDKAELLRVHLEGPRAPLASNYEATLLPPGCRRIPKSPTLEDHDQDPVSLFGG